MRRARKIAAREEVAENYLDPRTFTDDEPAVLEAELVAAQPAPVAALPPGVVDPDQLAPVLLSQPEGSPARRLLEAIFNKRAEGKPLAFYCEEVGMDFEDLVEMVERHYSGMARINSSKHFVEIFEDTAIDAKARIGMCDKCFGTGRAHVAVDGMVIETPNPCPICEGVGRRRYPADRHARAIMFEAMGIVGKSKQPLVAIQQNINVSGQQASKVGFAQKLLAAGRK